MPSKAFTRATAVIDFSPYATVEDVTTALAAKADASALASDLSDVDDALALLAPLASPALTGDPTAPTQAAADDSTKIATTAHVKDAIASKVGSVSVVTNSGNWYVQGITASINPTTGLLTINVNRATQDPGSG